EDPMLVEHLVRVGALAKSLAQDDLVLSRTGGDLLSNLCLYHAFGGYLTEEGERNEDTAIAEFKRAADLDLRLLDSRIAIELIELNRSHQTPAEHEVTWLLNKNVNSTVEFLRKRKMNDRTLRDLIVGLLQVQTSPTAFDAFRKSLDAMGVGELDDEVERVFA